MNATGRERTRGCDLEQERFPVNHPEHLNRPQGSTAPDDPTVIYSRGDVAAIAFYRRLLEDAYDVRDVPDIRETDRRPREPNADLIIVWDLAPLRS